MHERGNVVGRVGAWVMHVSSIAGRVEVCGVMNVSREYCGSFQSVWVMNGPGNIVGRYEWVGNECVQGILVGRFRVCGVMNVSRVYCGSFQECVGNECVPGNMWVVSECVGNECVQGILWVVSEYVGNGMCPGNIVWSFQSVMC
ncbi:hypothetical protein HNY73_017132 [Argiope bruennichi]|uniref:Uncharacterized protein n=1 Tax=Argiope bruennichi TaxID=94029 RepID=A0A8T0EKV8_ARGBR|nr:hypothetical protein HNY73_017132 [Argiope bruennichi]